MNNATMPTVSAMRVVYKMWLSWDIWYSELFQIEDNYFVWLRFEVGSPEVRWIVSLTKYRTIITQKYISYVREFLRK
jgi:hypothetical protein